MTTEKELFDYIRRIDIRELEKRCGKVIFGIVQHNAWSLYAHELVRKEEQSFKTKALKALCKVFGMKYNISPADTDIIPFTDLKSTLEKFEGTGWTVEEYQSQVSEAIRRQEAHNKKFERLSDGIYYIFLFMVIAICSSLHLTSLPLYAILPLSLGIGYGGGYLSRVMSRKYSERITRDTTEFYK